MTIGDPFEDSGVAVHTAGYEGIFLHIWPQIRLFICRIGTPYVSTALPLVGAYGSSTSELFGILLHRVRMHSPPLAM